ncbi:pyridoxal phosphate homeostasis protein-like [Glycine max]|uniref:pyridoxal phosphate homeostasis protein-like n=1 Tax=Glycine max TaxID=3847 RepID=UPI001B3554B2|nr:pyridoxal phosphate homeostasis protein-like [Glycine max]
MVAYVYLPLISWEDSCQTVTTISGGVLNLAMVESVDNQKVANHLDHMVSTLGRNPLKVLVQVNTSGEECKFSLKL